MADTVYYEWDYETVDEHGDIIDHHHSDDLATIYVPSEEIDNFATKRLVLIRNKGNDVEGLKERLWAYVTKEGLLPSFFSDDGEEPTGVHTPSRFHRELAMYKRIKGDI